MCRFLKDFNDGKWIELARVKESMGILFLALAVQMLLAWRWLQIWWHLRDWDRDSRIALVNFQSILYLRAKFDKFLCATKDLEGHSLCFCLYIFPSSSSECGMLSKNNSVPHNVFNASSVDQFGFIWLLSSGETASASIHSLTIIMHTEHKMAIAHRRSELRSRLSYCT